jgi:hypothetical protein
MKYFRYVALLAILAVPMAFAHAGVVVGVGVGPVGVGIGAAPVCAYGYYPDYPYSCAPYGYYGPSWFANGVFIGAGPWYHGWGHPVYPARWGWGHGYAGGWGRGYAGRGYVGHGYAGRGYVGHGAVARGPAGGGFHGGGGFRGRR